MKRLYPFLSIIIVSSLMLGCGSAVSNQAASTTNSSNQDLEYNKALGLIKEKRWTEARESLSKLTDYKDANVLDTYAHANIAFNMAISNDEQAAYRRANNNLSSINNNYSGELSEDILRFKKEIADKVTVMDKQVEINKEEKSKNDQNEAVQLIKQEDYQSAYMKVADNKSDEGRALYNFAKGRDWMKDGTELNKRVALNYFADIPMDYNGVLATEIKNFKLQYMTSDKWIEKYNELLKRKSELANYKVTTTTTRKNPAIGMTTDEVKNSTWGSPEKINKTTMSNGTSEQWVYSIDKYIYFENGKVSAIQEGK
jgi:hypothetical protein